MNAPSKMPELVIDRPELQPPVQRTVFRVLTLAAWSAYLYLWLPAVTLAAWWVGMYTGMGELKIVPAPFIDGALFGLLLQSAMLAMVLMIGWGEYNRRRFQGKERRGPRPIVTPAQSAAAFGVDPEVARRLRGARHCTLLLDEHAIACGLRVHEVLADAPTARIAGLDGNAV